MTTAHAVAFCFTSSHTVSLFGKDWTDSNGNPYKLSIFPGTKELTLKKGSPNVVLVTKFESRYNLSKLAKELHRVILFCTPNEAVSLGVPVIDAQLDESGKPIGPIRTRVEALREMIEGGSAPISLERATKKKKKKKKKKAKKVPKNLTALLDDIEEQVEEGDIWEDLEYPLIVFALGKVPREDFMTSCQVLSTKGVKQSLAKGYYKWVTSSESGTLLLSALEAILNGDSEYEKFIEEDGSIHVNKASKAAGVLPSDLNVLLSIHQQYQESNEE
jgi:hypothetical protein